MGTKAGDDGADVSRGARNVQGGWGRGGGGGWGRGCSRRGATTKRSCEVDQPATGGRGRGRDALDGEVVVEILESGVGQDEGGGMRELGRPAITERWGRRGRGGGGGMNQPDFRG